MKHSLFSGRKFSCCETPRMIQQIYKHIVTKGILHSTNSMTAEVVKKVSHTNVKILDTRKTTPGMRMLEKKAVKVGGGFNHRFGLYDMLMIKDNHIDFCGGINEAMKLAEEYLSKNQLDLKIEVETRDMDDVKLVLAHGNVDRVMLDNFTPEKLAEAVELVDGLICFVLRRHFNEPEAAGLARELVRNDIAADNFPDLREQILEFTFHYVERQISNIQSRAHRSSSFLLSQEKHGLA